MAKSLQEQLMGSGLVDKKKAKSIQKEKRNKRKQLPKGHEIVDEAKLRIEQQQRDKLEQDRQLNKTLHNEQESKAIQAQVRQLVKNNAISRGAGEIGFQFVVNKKIKKIHINSELQHHLLKGQLAIASLDDEYVLIPRIVADKVLERNKESIVFLDTKNNEQEDMLDEDDPYKGYEIPDDLMW